jgi:putative endonuclease
MLRCADNTFYTGSTIDLVKRLHAHNSLSGGAKYTKMRRPVVLIHTEEYETFAESRRREAEIKRMTRAKKLQLINGDLKRGIAK